MDFGRLTGRERTATEQFADSCCPKLSYQQRLYGFIGCFSIGWVMSVLGGIMLFKKQIKTFAVLYGFGQLIALLATFFLSGPKKACKMVFHKKRIGAACFYIGMIIVVISCGLADVAPGIVILLLIIQLCAAIWYAPSSFPYGRTILKNCATKPCT